MTIYDVIEHAQHIFVEDISLSNKLKVRDEEKLVNQNIKYTPMRNFTKPFHQSPISSNIF